MMIVKERSLGPVLAAFAWLAIVYVWQADVAPRGPAGIDAPEASHVERGNDARTAAIGTDSRES